MRSSHKWEVQIYVITPFGRSYTVHVKFHAHLRPGTSLMKEPILTVPHHLWPLLRTSHPHTLFLPSFFFVPHLPFEHLSFSQFRITAFRITNRKYGTGWVKQTMKQVYRERPYDPDFFVFLTPPSPSKKLKGLDKGRGVRL